MLLFVLGIWVFCNWCLFVVLFAGWISFDRCLFDYMFLFVIGGVFCCVDVFVVYCVVVDYFAIGFVGLDLVALGFFC